MPKESDFALEEAPDPEPGAGEVLVRNRFLSVDPYQRGRMSEARSYAQPLQIGDVITSQSVGEVAATNDPRFAAGDWVVGQTGWQELAAARAGTLRKIDSKLAPPTTALRDRPAPGSRDAPPASPSARSPLDPATRARGRAQFVDGAAALFADMAL